MKTSEFAVNNYSKQWVYWQRQICARN